MAWGDLMNINNIRQITPAPTQNASSSAPIDKSSPAYAKQKLVQVSQAYGVPTWITSAIVETESSFNPKEVGDNGTSFGLLQLHYGGQAPSNMNAAQLEDVDTNLQIGFPYIANAYKQGVASGLQGFSLLEYTAGHSGHPGGDLNHYVMSNQYDASLLKNFNNGDELAGVSSASKPFLTGLPDLATKGVYRTYDSDTIYQKARSLGLNLVKASKFSYSFNGALMTMTQMRSWAMSNGYPVTLDVNVNVGWSDTPYTNPLTALAVNQSKAGVSFVGSVSDMTDGTYKFLRQIDQMAQFQPFSGNIMDSFTFLTENGGAFGIRFILVLIGIFVFYLGLKGIL